MKISEQRAREHGEVLTPTWMVHRMLKPLHLADTSERFLDLCAGPGAFILSALQQRLAVLPDGATVEQLHGVVRQLYGVELLEDNVLACRQAMTTAIYDWAAAHDLDLLEGPIAEILQVNIIRADVLTEQFLVPHWQGDAYKLMVPVPGFFTLVVSNPPYQRSIADQQDRNRSKATPLYHLFFDYARQLAPERISFIMPAKWYTGGWGLEAWRKSVLQEGRLESLYDYRDSKVIFPTAEVNGGICWVVWSKTHTGDTHVVRHDRKGALISDVHRTLLETGADFFIRDEAAASILHKVGSFTLPELDRFSSLLLSTTPFGLNSNFADYELTAGPQASVLLYYIKERELWVKPQVVTRNKAVVDQWKIFFPLCHNQHSKRIIGSPKVYGPGSACTHSYLVVQGFTDQHAAESCVSYMQTKFFRFLAAQLKISPIATKQVYRLIPRQRWDRVWTDEHLYDMYDLSSAERNLIETTVDTLS